MSGWLEVAIASSQAYHRRWSRSRGMWGFLAFVAVMCWFDLASRSSPGVSPWYRVIVFLAAWTGVLAGYDTIAQFRDERSLRLLLLRATPRSGLAAGLWFGATAVTLSAVALALIVLAIAGRVPSMSAGLLALPALMAGVGGFVAYAQAASAVLPRDTSAVLGVSALIFGAMPPEHWIPAAAPEFVGAMVTAVWHGIPTSLRLAAALADPGNLGSLVLLSLYPVVGLASTILMLRLPRLLRRQAAES